MNFTVTTKILITLSVLFCLIGVLGLFFIETRATVQDIDMLSFQQQGYSGIPNRRGGTNRGSQMNLAIAKYKYKVNSEVFFGSGLAEDYNGKTISIKYSSIFPSISISSSWIYFLLSFCFLFLAIGVRTVVLWVRGIMANK